MTNVESAPVANGAASPKPVPSSRESGPSYLSTLFLGSMRWVALGAVLVTLFARAAAPGLRGFAVGWDRFTNRSEVVSEVVSQLFALSMLALVVVLATEVARSRASVYLRVVAMLLSGAQCLVGFASLTSERSAGFMLGISCVAASTLAIAAGVDALKQPAAGSLGLVAILAGLSSSVRAVAVSVADRAALLPHSDGVDGSRVIATVAFALQVLLLAMGVAWLTTRAKKVASPAVVIALGIAAFTTRQISIEPNDPGPLYFLVKHGAERLLGRPTPFVPPTVQLFVAIFVPLLALAVVGQRRQIPALLGGLALLVLASGAAEIPLYGMAMVVASLSITLASRDARGVWAAIAARER